MDEPAPASDLPQPGPAGVLLRGGLRGLFLALPCLAVCAVDLTFGLFLVFSAALLVPAALLEAWCRARRLEAALTPRPAPPLGAVGLLGGAAAAGWLALAFLQAIYGGGVLRSGTLAGGLAAVEQMLQPGSYLVQGVAMVLLVTFPYGFAAVALAASPLRAAPQLPQPGSGLVEARRHAVPGFPNAVGAVGDLGLRLFQLGSSLTALAAGFALVSRGPEQGLWTLIGGATGVGLFVVFQVGFAFIVLWFLVGIARAADWTARRIEGDPK